MRNNITYHPLSHLLRTQIQPEESRSSRHLSTLALPPGRGVTSTAEEFQLNCVKLVRGQGVVVGVPLLRGFLHAPLAWLFLFQFFEVAFFVSLVVAGVLCCFVRRADKIMRRAGSCEDNRAGFVDKELCVTM